MNELSKIGQVATKLGMNPKTIRYYEEIGLIPPLKRTDIADLSSNGNRLFSKLDINRLELIKQLKPLDFSLSQIKEILDSVDTGCCPVSRPHLQKLIAEKLDDLKRLQKTLETIFQSAESAESNAKQEISCEGSNDPCGCVMGEQEVTFNPDLGNPNMGHT